MDRLEAKIKEILDYETREMFTCFNDCDTCCHREGRFSAFNQVLEMIGGLKWERIKENSLVE